MMLRRAIAAASLLALVAAAGGTASPAAQQPTNGRISFGMFGRLIITNPDGTGQWPLTPETVTYVPGDWSPDGTRLAVASMGDVYLVGPRGYEYSNLTSTIATAEHDPSFSPDGSQIVYESFSADRPPQIWMMNANGSSQRWVPAGAFPALDPEWSPDGKRIAWTLYGTEGPDIWTMNIDGTDRRRLTNHQGADQNPSWSPDGTRIAFDSDRNGSLDVFTMRIDGSDVRRLTTSPAVDAVPTWSPDGAKLAFMSDRGGERALFVMGVTGSAQRRLSVAADPTSAPAWQPLPRDALDTSPWGRQCTIWGTADDDLLVGTPGPDVICGLGGDDRLIGGEGDDLIAGEEGHDDIVGGPGRDAVFAGNRDDLVDVRDGEFDSVQGGRRYDTVLVDAGLDETSFAEKVFDPDRRNLMRGRPVRASKSLPDRPAEYAVDGHTGLIWGAVGAPAWIEVDLGHHATVGSVRVIVAQTPEGLTDHVVLGKGRDKRWRQLASFRGETRDGQVLRHTATRPLSGIRWIRVVTRRSPSWVAWKEVQAFAP